MSDIGEMFDARRQESRRKRARNREASAQLLQDAGVAFQVKNGGAHLIVMHKQRVFDFWPGTGLWAERKGTEGRGVHRLLQLLE